MVPARSIDYEYDLWYLQEELARVGLDHVILAKAVECVLVAIDTVDMWVPM